MSSKRFVNKNNRIQRRSKDLVRAQIFFSGRVQRMGFRSKAKEEAQMLGLKGLVENLKDGRVRVLCEGPKSKIIEFINIMKHSDELATVEKVRTFYSAFSGSFKEFEVKGGKFEDEMWQGFGTAERHLASMNRKLDTMGQDVKSVGQKVDGVGKKVGTVGHNIQNMHKDVKVVGKKVDGVGKKVGTVGRNIQNMHKDVKVVGKKVEHVGHNFLSMHKDMNENFTGLDGKYHIFGEGLIETNRNLERMNENNARMNDNLKDMIENNKVLTEEIKEIVEDYISEKRRKKDQGTGQT